MNDLPKRVPSPFPPPNEAGRLPEAWAPPLPGGLVSGIDPPEGLTPEPGPQYQEQEKLAGVVSYGRLKAIRREVLGPPGEDLEEDSKPEAVPVRILGIRDIPNLIRTRNELERERETDQLTGLRNKLGFEHELEKRISLAEAGGDTSFGVLYLDLDGFKRLNDRLGHHKGDELLRKFGRFVGGDKTEEEPAFKWRDGEEIFRLHGDEFAAIIHTKTQHNDRRNPSANEEEIAEGYVKRLDGAVKGIGKQIHKRIRVGASVGYAKFETGDTVDSILNRADHRMYQVKRNRKGTFTKLRGHIRTSRTKR